MIDPVPEDFHTITPQLVVKGVAGAIDWYARALGAHELLRNMSPDGVSIMHAELLGLTIAFTAGPSRLHVSAHEPFRGQPGHVAAQ